MHAGIMHTHASFSVAIHYIYRPIARIFHFLLTIFRENGLVFSTVLLAISHVGPTSPIYPRYTAAAPYLM